MAFYGDGKHDNDIEVRQKQPVKKRTKTLRSLKDLTEAEAIKLVRIGFDDTIFFDDEMAKSILFWAKSFGHDADLFVNCFKRPVSVVRALEKMKFKL